jgi:hypothetical protein
MYDFYGSGMVVWAVGLIGRVRVALGQVERGAAAWQPAAVAAAAGALGGRPTFISGVGWVRVEARVISGGGRSSIWKCQKRENELNTNGTEANKRRDEKQKKKRIVAGLPDFLCTIYQNGVKNTKFSQNYQIGFGMKIYHLATLNRRGTQKNK